MKTYQELFEGTLWGVMQWTQWDEMRERIVNAGEWYVYALGHDLPESTISGSRLTLALSEMDALLRKDHKEKYLGIVYADDLMSPTLIKVYDPNNLGSSCGSSGRKILPGWVLSRIPPEPMVSPYPVPQGRLRWWQELKDRISGHH
ncbi:MAG TPA: hypothetical protein VFR06_07385 [Gallionellaceae bacterium]|nr:hypothetical protein [Gallionellaceae bacterium]